MDSRESVRLALNKERKKKKKNTEQTLQHHLKLEQTQNTVTDTDEKTKRELMDWYE